MPNMQSVKETCHFHRAPSELSVPRFVAPFDAFFPRIFVRDASRRASYGINFARSVGILRSPGLLSRCVYHLICSDISWKFRIDTQPRVRRTMSIPKLRQVCEGDPRSSRRQMVAVLSTLCIGSRLNKFSAYYYTKYIY